jgi:formiminotetrahydrofolate cyclodeaminase
MTFLDFTLRDFLAAAASPRPTPGGGTVAALAGALAAAMAEMAANFTFGKKRFAAVQARVQELRDQLTALRARLVQLMDADAEAFTRLQEAQHLPKTTPAEVAKRQKAVDAAASAAAAVPAGVADTCLEMLGKARQLADICNPRLLSDVAVCAHIARGAIEAAHVNILVNLRGSMETSRLAEEEAKIPFRRGNAEAFIRAVEEVCRTRGATGSPAETGMYDAQPAKS